MNTDFNDKYYGGATDREKDKGTLSNMNTDVIPLYWDPILIDTYINRHQLTALLVHAKRAHPATSRKFSWGDYYDNANYIKVVTNAASFTITVTEQDREKLTLRMKLWDKTNDKHYLITAFPTTNTVTLYEIEATTLSATEPTGSDGTATWVVGDELMIASSSIPEGNTVSDSTIIATQKKVDNYYNYSQRYYVWLKTTTDKAAEKWEFTNTTYLAHQRMVKIQELTDQVERDLWINKRAYFAETAGMNYNYNGFNNFGIQKGTGSYSDFSFTQFMDFCQTYAKKYYDGTGGELSAFVNGQMFQKIASWAKTESQMNFDFTGEKNQIGIDVHKLVVPGLKLTCYENLALNALYSKTNEAIMNIVDLNNVSLISYAGNGLDFGFNVKREQQAKTDDFILDLVSWTVGMKMVKETQASQLWLT